MPDESFTELVGVPPSVYRDQQDEDLSGIPACEAKKVTRPVRNREARPGTTPLA